MFWDFVLRLLLAGVLGAAIGVEREYRAKGAGFRTHLLVALASALMMIVSMYGFDSVINGVTIRLDPSRIAGQVLTGVGFIGAGTIIMQKQVVRGLTTAAGIFATAGIGLAVGCGMYWLAVVATLLVLAGMELFSFIFKKTGGTTVLIAFSTTRQENIQAVNSEMIRLNCRIMNYNMTRDLAGEPVLYRVEAVFRPRRLKDEELLLRYVHALPDLMIETIE